MSEAKCNIGSATGICDTHNRNWRICGERQKVLKEVEEIIELCGQVSGSAIRENVNSDGTEMYIRVDELKSALEKVFEK